MKNKLITLAMICSFSAFSQSDKESENIECSPQRLSYDSNDFTYFLRSFLTNAEIEAVLELLERLDRERNGDENRGNNEQTN